MEAKKLINSILAALLVAFGVYMIVGLSLNKPSGFLFLLAWGLFSWYFSKQDTIRGIWRKSFIYFAIESFLMPVAMFLFTIVFISNNSANGAEALGGAIGGGIMMLLTGFLGVFLGTVFLLIGLLVLKEKESTSKRKK